MKWTPKSIFILIVSVACITGGLAVMMWCFVDLVRRVESPRHLEVATCDTSDVTFSTMLPPGHAFNLVLAIPGAERLSPTLRIHVVVSDQGGTIADFSILSADVQDCNWLHTRPDLQGNILSWKNLLRDKVQGRHTYRFAIHFSEALPQGSSLWLCYFQNGKDRRGIAP